MKLVLAIISNDDTSAATSALTGEGFFVTRLSSAGGFLTVKNTTLLIGTDEDKIPLVRDILKKYCSHSDKVTPGINSFGRGLSDDGNASENSLGGAVMFVLDVDKFEKI